MILWIDAQLSPALAPWITAQFEIDAHSVKDLGYRNATDRAIFDAARGAGAVVMTKDGDFVALLEQMGPPPQVLWVTMGNTSNEHLKRVLSRTLRPAQQMLEAGEPLVEIQDRV